MKRILCTLLLSLASLQAASITLTPGPNVSGNAGSTVGWGYSIDNDTSSWLLVTSANPSGFDPGMGSFQDFLVSINATIVAPNSILSQAFDNSLQQGFGSFAISNSAILGSVTGASILLNYDLLVNDPFGPLGGDPGDVFGLEFTVNPTVSVPSAAWLSGLGMCAIACARHRRKRSSRL
jgi:hypothetical protein